jgi:hypothetical protein
MMSNTIHPTGLRPDSGSELRLRTPKADSDSAPTYVRTDGQRTVLTYRRHLPVSQRARCKRRLAHGLRFRMTHDCPIPTTDVPLPEETT